MSTDKINPDHYKSRSIECIEFTRELSFSLGNAFKYLWRCGMKDGSEQELAKVKWYLADHAKNPLGTTEWLERNELFIKLESIEDEFDKETYLKLFDIICLSWRQHYE